MTRTYPGFAVVRHRTVANVLGVYGTAEEAEAERARVRELEGDAATVEVVPTRWHPVGRGDAGAHHVVADLASEPRPSMDELLEQARAAGMDPFTTVPVDQMTARVAVNVLAGLDRLLRSRGLSYEDQHYLTLGQVDEDPNAPDMLRAALEGVLASLRTALADDPGRR